MQLLLDTPASLWWLARDSALTVAAPTAIPDEGNRIFVSAASAWELATKHRSGRLANVAAIVTDLEQAAVDQGFVGLSNSLRHAQAAGGLPGPHRNPFDRMPIARPMLEKRVVVSHEHRLDAYGVPRLW